MSYSNCFFHVEESRIYSIENLNYELGGLMTVKEFIANHDLYKRINKKAIWGHEILRAMKESVDNLYKQNENFIAPSSKRRTAPPKLKEEKNKNTIELINKEDIIDIKEKNTN